MSRLRKSSFKLQQHLSSINVQPLGGNCSKRYVWQLPSMQAAADTIAPRLRYWPCNHAKTEIIAAIPQRAVAGEPQRLQTAVDDSATLVDAAIAADPRLARRSQWFRGEEGELCCPALLAEGDDAPFFHRRRTLESSSNGGTPVRVVISTDSNKLLPRTAAAFIATIRLVQQWRPVEVWWQGAWMNADGYNGYVFHVPLVQGDMDFARLEFCIADGNRDNLSWACMMTYAIEQAHENWAQCNHPARTSHLPDTDVFIPHTGIEPDGESIAAMAARMLEWDSLYAVRYGQEQILEAAVQHWRPEPEPTRRTEYRETAEDKRRREKQEKQWQREREAKEASAAAARAANLGHNY